MHREKEREREREREREIHGKKHKTTSCALLSNLKIANNRHSKYAENAEKCQYYIYICEERNN